MPRVPQHDRLTDVISAATRIFGRLGFRRTQMAAVASDAGLSTGAIYTYVESKEALFHVVFEHGFNGLAVALQDLPIAAPPFDDTLKLISLGLRRGAAQPRLKAALDGPPPRDVRRELVEIIEERYTSIANVWPLLAVIERSAVDLPKLEALYYRGRGAQIGQLARYLERRAEDGHLNAFPDPIVAARAVTETITWFAWHRHEDRDREMYPDNATHETVVAFLCDALIAPAT